MTEDLMTAVIHAKPVDFNNQFAAAMQDKVNNLVADRKLEIAKNFFGTSSPPNEPEEGGNEVESDEDETDNEEIDDTPEDSDTDNDSEEDE